MNAPLVVGVCHSKTGNLMDQECRDRFTKRIFPLITEDTLLLLEGDHQEGYISRDDQRYHLFRDRIEHDLGAQIGAPTIGWRDGRFKNGNALRHMAWLNHFAGLFLAPHIRLYGQYPATFKELCALITADRVRYELNPAEDVEHLERYCTEILMWNDLFDDPMIASAREWAQNDSLVIIVCGGLHALTLHKRTGWPTTHLIDSPEFVRYLTHLFITHDLYPRSKLGRTSSPASR